MREAVRVLMIWFYCIVFSNSVMAANTTGNSKPLKVGFIMSGPINDMGWNNAQNKGRLYLESKLGNQIQTSYFESVPG